MQRPEKLASLLVAMLDTLGGKVRKVVVEDLKEQTFYAVIHVDQDDRHLKIDARPSDAIALALRTKAPVFVDPVVLQKAQADDGTTEEERVKRLLEELDVEDLGEYEM